MGICQSGGASHGSGMRVGPAPAQARAPAASPPDPPNVVPPDPSPPPPRSQPSGVKAAQVTVLPAAPPPPASASVRPAGADFSAAFRARHEALRGGPLPPFAAESLAEARKAAADGSHRGVALPAEAARSLGLAARLVTQPFAANGAVEEAVARAAAGLGGLVGSVRGKLVCVLDFQYHVRQRTALAHVVMQPHSSFQFSFTLTPAGTISSAVMTPLEKMALEHLGCMYGDADTLCFRSDLMAQREWPFVPLWWRQGRPLTAAEAEAALWRAMGPPRPGGGPLAALVHTEVLSFGRRRSPADFRRLGDPSHAEALAEGSRAFVAALQRTGLFAPGAAGDKALTPHPGLGAAVTRELVATLPRAPAAASGGARDAADLSGVLLWVLEQVNARKPAHQRVPGVAVGGLAAGRGVVCVGAAGLRRADREDSPAGPSDAWHIGSNTKSVAATLFARLLVDGGPFTFDSSLDQLLPHLAAGMSPQVRCITAAQLLSHRSGLPFMVDAAAMSAEEREVALSWTRDPFECREAVVRFALHRGALAHEPGTAHLYSNLGFVVLGHAIESHVHRAAGGAAAGARASFEQLCEQHLLAPLGICRVAWGPAGGPTVLDQPRGHTWGSDGAAGPVPHEPPRADNPPYMAPAGRLSLPMADYLRYADLHCRIARGEPTPLLRPEVGAQLQRHAAISHDGSNTMNYTRLQLQSSGASVATTNCPCAQTVALLVTLTTAVRTAAG